MNLCFDLDDVIANTYPQIIKAALVFHIDILRREDIANDLDIIHAEGDYFWFAKVLAWSEKELELFFHTKYPYFLNLCIPIKESVDFLNNMHKKNHNITILSSRETRDYADVQKITEQWLSDNGVYFDKVLLGYKNKYEYLKQNNIQLFVDDNIDNCKDAKKAGVSFVFCYISDYNLKGRNESSDGIIPIAGLSDVNQYIDLL